MKGFIVALAGLILGSMAPQFAEATETVASIIQVRYDANLRVQCTAVRMNPGVYSTISSTDACTLGTEGSYGPDRITKTIYDAANQVTEIDQAFGTSAQRAYARYTYSDDGLKTSEMDAKGNKTMFVYDGFDRLSQVQYPSTMVGSGAINAADYEQFTYDANGNRMAYRHRNSATIAYTYDALNRETLKDMPVWAGNTNGTSKDVYTGYDLQGHALYARFIGSAPTNAGITNVYDALGRLVTTTDAISRPIIYEYNQANARTKMTLPYVQTSSTTYDYETYSLDNLNRLLSLSYTAGTTTSVLFGQTYDNLGHRTNLYRGAAGASGAVATTTYGYDNLGRLTSLNNDLAATAYDINWTFSAYNPASQIVGWDASSTSYDYREVANSIDPRTYNGLNQDSGIASLAATCATAGAGYDCSGNLTSEGTSTGARTFTYDAENRLLTATGGSANLTLSYDPLGRLYVKTYGATTDTYLYDGVNLIGEYSSGGTQRRRYVFGAGTDEPLVWFEGQTSASPRYLISNYQGSVIAYTNNTGTVQELYKYGPYGEPKSASDTDLWSGSRFRYTGQTTLPEAYLYYYKARVYDPKYGRFLQTDPIGSKDDLDLYAYTAGDPINGSDPTGNQDWVHDLGAWINKTSNDFANGAVNYAAGLTQSATNIVTGKGTSGDLKNVGNYYLNVAAVVATATPASALAAPTLETAEGVNLASRVADVHGVLDPIAANMRTTAAATTTDGTTIFASGGRDLTQLQRAQLLPGEVAAASPGAHAEATIIDYTGQTGQSLKTMETSRPICTACQSKIEQSGGKVTGPTTAKWPW